jgi:hypothetical protein
VELKQIIGIIVIVAIVGLILFRTLPIKAILKNIRSKGQQADDKDDKEKTG